MNTRGTVMRIGRWVGLAAFCMVFGFVGSIGGLWLMNGDLSGPEGEPGEPGKSVTGPPGPRGARGPATPLPENLFDVSVNWDTLVDDLATIRGRLDALENDPESPCLPTAVVTDVEVDYFGNLDVRKSPICR